MKVEVSRKEYSELYLEVPDDFDHRRIDPDILKEAAIKTLDSDFDWDDFGWSETVEEESVEVVGEEIANQFEVYKVGT